MSPSPYADIHDDLRAVARDLLARTSPVTSGGDARPMAWDEAARAGWLGLEVPDSLDGAGATVAEVAVILHEMGRAATLAPYLGSVVLAVGLLGGLEPSDGRDAALRAISGGRERFAVATPAGEPEAREPAFRLQETGGRVTVRGAVQFVADGLDADRLLLPARGPDDRPLVVCVARDQPGIDVVARPVVDGTRRFAALAADGALVDDGSVWAFSADPDACLQRLHDRGSFAAACDSLGLAEAMLEATVDYAATRRQFDRPIGSFQAVKHTCAAMYVQVRVGRELVAAAQDALLEDRADAWVAVSMAKSQVTAAAVTVAGQAMQMHGGIGYTWERGVHAYLKRAALNRTLFGSPAAHRRRLARRY